MDVDRSPREDRRQLGRAEVVVQNDAGPVRIGGEEGLELAHDALGVVLDAPRTAEHRYQVIPPQEVRAAERPEEPDEFVGSLLG